ncbi:MAG: folylpolyglutamate synthase/dihydrofolate synthase family protein [Candidatus Omnitrophota bacterium]
MTSFSVDGYFQTFLNWESKLQQAAPAAFSLERMERLLAVFGHPEEKLRFAHIAGTKGKGSTSAFLASILRASGYRVGLYTSPHLYDVRERIRVLEVGHSPAGVPGDIFGDCITADALERLVQYYYDDIEVLRRAGTEVTFYELITALAAAYFAAREVQIVVLETGLGGRLDATNVFETSVCGITPLGFDHTHILGNTLAAIAAEKAGIIKAPYQRVSMAPPSAEALTVIEAHCRKFNIIPSVVGQDLACHIGRITAEGVAFDVHGRRVYEGLVSPLTGAHQAQNAALAIAMAEDLEIFGFLLTEEAVRDGIKGVRWPLRFERAAVDPVVIIDGAHTAESARALVSVFQAAYPGRKAVVVVGMSADKDVMAVTAALSPVTEAMVLTRADHPRSAEISSSEVGKVLSGVPIVVTQHVAAAMDEARRMAGRDGIVLVTGSLFAGAEARAYVSV